jgi:hypothetical protein
MRVVSCSLLQLQESRLIQSCNQFDIYILKRGDDLGAFHSGVINRYDLNVKSAFGLLETRAINSYTHCEKNQTPGTKKNRPLYCNGSACAAAGCKNSRLFISFCRITQREQEYQVSSASSVCFSCMRVLLNAFAGRQNSRSFPQETAARWWRCTRS